MRLSLVVASIVALACAARESAAQSPAARAPVAEFGVDAALPMAATADAGEIAERPVPVFRLGVIVSDHASVEMTVGGSLLGGRGTSVTVGGLFHLTGRTRAGGVYLRPFIAFDAQRVVYLLQPSPPTITVSEVAMGGGIALGARGLWTSRLAWRVEGVAGYLDGPGNWFVVLQPRAGLSLFF